MMQLSIKLLLLSKKHSKITYSANESSGRWIAYRKPKKEANSRLFCFPYGGGGASLYQDWQTHLTTIEVCPIQLPARENRIDETPMLSVTEIVEALAQNLQQEFDKPFAFLGHSFGALLSFELARYCRKHHLPAPQHIFISAFPDPRTPTTNLNNLIADLQAEHLELCDIKQPHIIDQLTLKQLNTISMTFKKHGILDYGDALLNKDIMKILLPIFIGDMCAIRNYSYQVEPPFDFPISVFIGKQDRWISYDDQLSWSHYTRQGIQFYEFDGGHLFIKDNKIKQEILAIISKTLISQNIFTSNFT